MGDIFLINAWRNLCGLPDVEVKKLPPPDELREQERSPLFEKLRRNRMVMGALRYGRLGDKNKPQYNRIDSIKKRILIYEETGNLECLLDIANLCECEFVEGKHLKRHFNSVDDGEHAKKITDTN